MLEGGGAVSWVSTDGPRVMPCDIFLTVIFYFFFQVAFVYFDSPKTVVNIIREYNSYGLSEPKYIASRGRAGRRRGTSSLQISFHISED
jgi:hypothetical protein